MSDTSPDIKLSQAYLESLMNGVKSEIQSIDSVLISLSSNIQTLSDAEKYKPIKHDLLEESRKLEKVLSDKLIEIQKSATNIENLITRFNDSDETHTTHIETLIGDIKNIINGFDRRLWRFIAICGISFFVFMFIMGLIQAGVIKI